MCFSFEKKNEKERRYFQTSFSSDCSKAGTSFPLIEIQPLLTFAYNT